MDTSFVSFLSCRLPNVYLDWLQIHTLPHDVQEEGPAVLKWVASCLFVCFLRAGIATRYGLDDAAFEPLWGRDFPVPSRPVRGPHNLFYNAYRISFSRLSSQGMALTIHALLAVRIEYGYAIPLPFLCDCMVRDEFLFIYLFIGQESSVGTATRYGLYGLGIESLWGRDFPHPSKPALRPTQPPIQRVPGLSWG